MIDTDKYTGHTPAPWAYREDEVYAEGNPCIVALRAHGTDGELTSKLPHRWADFALIADAPLLLEFIQKIVKEWNVPNKCPQEFGKDVRQLMYEYGLIIFDEETRRYEVKK